MKNYRTETSTTTQQFTNPDGTSFDLTYQSGSHTAYEMDCEKCGKEYTVRGIFGGLRSICVGDICPDCEAALEDGNEQR